MMSDDRADHQPDPGSAPDLSDPGGAPLEHELAEEAEQDLRRAPAGRPSDSDEPDGENQRRRPHVSQAFHILVPRPDHTVFGQILPLGLEGPRRRSQQRDAIRGNGKRQRIECEAAS